MSRDLGTTDRRSTVSERKIVLLSFASPDGGTHVLSVVVQWSDPRIRGKRRTVLLLDVYLFPFYAHKFR